ncbi:hypothetical protein LPN01_07835 [Sphingomonas sp. A2-49]|uniref:hypothetical protein n=1 Tax=Sphingomonas sp. A2-49 TaxID=1391375 RepID=UPI0021D0FDF9|nr:hypothetical protein [Sphingomonas sp. A2-49]MCU6453984.1 hypothetical protein [Sphingomonas sp. A2-49]
MNRPVEREAGAIKARLHIGERLEVAMSILMQNGFACEVLDKKIADPRQLSLLCRKMFVDNRWWGLTEYHDIRVLVDVNAKNIVTSVDVSIIWGGLRGL